jgi:hypothetical protein
MNPGATNLPSVDGPLGPHLPETPHRDDHSVTNTDICAKPRIARAVHDASASDDQVELFGLLGRQQRRQHSDQYGKHYAAAIVPLIPPAEAEKMRARRLPVHSRTWNRRQWLGSTACAILRPVLTAWPICGWLRGPGDLCASGGCITPDDGPAAAPHALARLARPGSFV